jgi:uncharacterized protein YprB with RNaseH-like and TPR domain
MDHTPLIVDLETVSIADAEQYLTDPITAPSNWKDPEKIAAYIADATKSQLNKCALDPDLARIVALGYIFQDSNTPVVHVIKDEATEQWALTEFWRHVITAGNSPRQLVTFNGLRFDLPVLMRRSLYLGVPYPKLNLDRYRTIHLDLYDILTYHGVLPAHSLRFYCARFGILIDDLTTGKDIAQLVAEGNLDAVVAHCQADVMATQALARRVLGRAA